MKFSSETTLQFQPCAHTIYRPFGGVASYRLISDPAGRLAVTTFPSDQWSACYVLTGHGQAYIAQSSCAMKSIAEHAVDPAKAFAAEVFLVHAQEEPRTMDWSTRLYLEHRLSELAKEAGLVHLANTVEPRVLPWRLEQAATLELLVAQARRLLFDGGCRVLDGSRVNKLPAEAETDDNQNVNEVVETGLPMAPPPEDELEFDYCDIRARGYLDHEGFVVKSGSEVRNIETPSLRQNIKRLRADLLASGVVVPTPDIKDRLRFQVDWRFFSPAVAAKFVAGAHVAGTKWVRRRSSPPIGRTP